MSAFYHSLCFFKLENIKQMNDLKYLSALTIPLTACIALQLKGGWLFLTPAYAFVFIPLIESVLPTNNENFSKEKKEKRNRQKQANTSKQQQKRRGKQANASENKRKHGDRQAKTEAIQAKTKANASKNKGKHRQKQANT